ncbi:MAG: type I polyketide synthase, partial [Desulfobacteraceae bacterium]
SGDTVEDGIEADVIDSLYKNADGVCAVGSVKPNIGHTGSASGIASLIKSALCLYHETIPPLLNFRESRYGISSGLHFPVSPQFWYRNRIDGPRRLCAASITRDGNCMHVLLEGHEYQKSSEMPAKASTEQSIQLVCRKTALFVAEGRTKNELLEKLDGLLGSVDESINIHDCGLRWFADNKPNFSNKCAISIVAADTFGLRRFIAEAKSAVDTNIRKRMNGHGGICYSPEPLGSREKIAFVFPGSGNHYIGMGRGIGIYFPEILKKMDRKAKRLKTQIVPECFVPWRNSWKEGWENDARDKIASNPLNMIFGQVLYGEIISALVTGFGIRPSAVIGYSLGESAGNFATNLWPDHEEMLKRMTKTDLFTTQLAGPCNSIRKAWNISSGEDFKWCAAMVNRPSGDVRKTLDAFPRTRLLIVNTPDECVIGGARKDIEKVITKLKCEAVFLEGVVTVHCDAVNPVAGRYRSLHLFPVTPPEGVKFYSCALGRSFDVTSESAADSILMQATSGFDFAATIEQAYKDGIRVFLEMGPHSSCTRMIDRILGDRDHLAVSASFRGEDEYLSIIKFLGAIAAERMPFDMGKLYGLLSTDKIMPADLGSKRIILSTCSKGPSSDSGAKEKADISLKKAEGDYFDLIELISKSVESTSEAHRKFLEFSNDMSKAYAEALELQMRLIKDLNSGNRKQAAEKPLFTREMCMEFATGSVAKVLGPEFAIADTYRTRVRLPDEPLMLVDRIISVEGEKTSLGPGKVTTEHDVLPGVWYLDGNRAPVCISVEAGQADLFLCSYLGIDLAVKGERTYRLLDATVKFHCGLPQPGDTIRYDIEIEKFVRQKDTYLFFFKFDGYIGDKKLITMRDGCAGFFTEDEVKNSGGIILTEKEISPAEAKSPCNRQELVPFYSDKYDDDSLDLLRRGDLDGCFGHLFEGKKLADSLKLPGGRMKLIDRILSIDPTGGRFGLGIIRAEADIHPNDWFL